jgi:phenylacetic acid degradation operon negative regulatory protein
VLRGEPDSAGTVGRWTVNARSALFDLYGDHLRARGGVAPVAALVRLLAPLDVAAPAVRTAISRMVRQGWLRPTRTPAGPAYALTGRAARRLDDAAARIYRTHGDWDGYWHLLLIGRVRDRGARERLRSGLGFLGYGSCDEGAWISARPSPEVDALLDAEGVRADRFVARHDGDTAGLVDRIWDVDALGRSYSRWLEDAVSIVDAAGPEPADEVAFAARSRLVHEWRKFLFRDPGLPAQLLPPDWVGHKAASFFDQEAERLLPAANRFVDGVLKSPRG